LPVFCDERLRFLQALKTWPVFGAGWGRRVAEVKSTALKMAADAAKASTMARNK
jgi:lysozyme family protein